MSAGDSITLERRSSLRYEILRGELGAGSVVKYPDGWRVLPRFQRSPSRKGHESAAAALVSFKLLNRREAEAVVDAADRAATRAPDLVAAALQDGAPRTLAAAAAIDRSERMPSHPNRSKQTRFAKANPTPAEIINARKAAGDTQTDAAARIYATLRTWQDWENDGPENRRMHPGLFELYLLKAGLKSLKEILEGSQC